MPIKLTEQQQIKKKPSIQKKKQKSFGERALEIEFGIKKIKASYDCN